MASIGDPLNAGYETGFERASGEGLELPFEQVAQPRQLLYEVLSPPSVDLHPRFVSLFAEQVAIASVARSFYGDSPLTSGKMRWYLRHSREFFNSFVHP